MQMEETMDKVYIDPYFDPYYGYFLIKGLVAQFGPRTLELKNLSGPRPALSPHGLMVECILKGARRRLYLNVADSTDVEESLLGWADVYGKANLLDSDAARGIIPLGPVFGVAPSLGEAQHALRFFVSQRRLGQAVGRSWRDLVSKRLPLSAYSEHCNRGDYIFYAAWPWLRHQEVNPPRAAFIRAARSVQGITFEGGFAPLGRVMHHPREGLEDVTGTRHYSLRSYLKRMRCSAVAFNCPAVHGCLGWKLGEFLMMGKPIISLPLMRRMPSGFEHGRNVHFVNSADPTVLAEALRELLAHDEYRKSLGYEARRYWESALSPAAVIRNCISTAYS